MNLWNPKDELVDFYLYSMEPVVNFFGRYGISDITVTLVPCLLLISYILFDVLKRKKKDTFFIVILVVAILGGIGAIIKYQFFEPH